MLHYFTLATILTKMCAIKFDKKKLHTARSEILHSSVLVSVKLNNLDNGSVDSHHQKGLVDGACRWEEGRQA